MPTMDEPDLENLRITNRSIPPCLSCQRKIWRNYCRSHDEFFTQGHDVDRCEHFTTEFKHSECKTYAHELGIYDGKDFHCRLCDKTEFLRGPSALNVSFNFACKNCWARYNDDWPFSINHLGFVCEADRPFYIHHGPYVPRTRRLKT